MIPLYSGGHQLDDYPHPSGWVELKSDYKCHAEILAPL